MFLVRKLNLRRLNTVQHRKAEQGAKRSWEAVHTSHHPAWPGGGTRQPELHRASSSEAQKFGGCRASLVAQWLRIRLPMQGTRVQSVVREDPTCRGVTKPVRHNY